MENETSEFGHKLIKAVREVAAEMPGHVTDECNYFDRDNGEPQCIFGRAFHRLGIDKALVPEGTIDVILRREEAGVKHGIVVRWPEVTDREFEWIYDVQAAQDGRMSDVVEFGDRPKYSDLSEYGNKMTYENAVEFGDRRDANRFKPVLLGV